MTLLAQSLRLVTCALLLTSVLPLPSYAGHYTVTYNDTFTPPFGDPTSDTNTATAPNYSSPQYYSGAMSLAVTPTLTWTPDGPGDTSTAPAQVSYIEYGAISMSINDIAHPASGVNVTSQTATDDLGDPSTPYTAPQYGVHSLGYHAVGPTSASSLSKRTLSASFTWTTSDPIAPAGGGVGYALYPLYISLPS